MPVSFVLYNGFECKVIFDYGNGNLEILYGQDVLLVSDKEVKILAIN